MTLEIEIQLKRIADAMERQNETTEKWIGELRNLYRDSSTLKAQLQLAQDRCDFLHEKCKLLEGRTGEETLAAEIANSERIEKVAKAEILEQVAYHYQFQVVPNGTAFNSYTIAEQLRTRAEEIRKTIA